MLMAFFCLLVAGFVPSEPARLLIAIFSLALVAQSWFVQRRFTKSGSRLILFALIHTLIALGAIWLGLNVVRFYSYAPDLNRASLYSTVVTMQAAISWCAVPVAVVTFYWLLGETASFLGQRVSRRLVGDRKTWWNRPLTGVCLWGYAIGMGVSALIMSSTLRWMVLACGISGLLFAVIFRIARHDDEI